MKPFNLSQRIARSAVNVRDYGAVGDNVTDDTAAVSAAITYCQNLPFTSALYLGGGFYKVTSLPQLTKPISIIGDDPRSSALMFAGSADAISIKGVSTRAAAIQFHNLSLVGHDMTGGYLVDIDWAQDILFENVIFNDPWNGVYARQIGDLQFRNCYMSLVRGTVGVDLYGANITRNGENDEIDIVIFDSVVIQANLPAIGGASSAILLRVDGRVHTIQTDGLRLLNGGIGLQTLNTPGLASNLVPRFFFGSSLEIENMQNQCVDAQAMREFKPASLFAVGSHAADGVRLNAAVADFAPVRCNISSNWFNGIDTNGAKSVRLTKPLIYNNSLVGVGLKDGVYVSGSGFVGITGGLIGKDTALPAYPEPQKCGVDLDAAFNGVLVMSGVDLRGNQSFGLYDSGLTATGSSVTNCPGYNPKGTNLQAVGASPYSYTAGLTVEGVNLYGGTGVVSSVAGVALANTVPAAFTLQPRQTVSISYATVPTMAVSKA
jgi:hypothetical protein